MSSPAQASTAQGSPLGRCLTELHARLPAGLVDRTAAALTAAASDRSVWGAASLPAAVVRASDEQHVQAVLESADRHGVPVVTRGAGTGLSGAASALPGCIVLDLMAMNRIVEIDAAGGCAVVQPGVVTAALDEAAAEHGLAFAPDPASAAMSTVGGNIATNAGGLRCVKYGTTRQAVLGLRVVLPGGRSVELGGRTKKNVTGLDLLGLLVGSEGTLGVIVEATVALIPRPTDERMLAVGCLDADQLQRCAVAIATSGVVPSMVELMDAAALRRRAPGAAESLGLPSGPAALLLVRTDGPAAGPELERLAHALADTGAAVSAPLKSEERRRAVAIRRGETLPGLADPAIGGGDDEWWLGEDMTVPVGRLAEFLHRAGRVAEECRVEVSFVAHLGDGNLHPSLTVPHSRMAEEPARAALSAAADALVRLALELGGNLTGEHGVGSLKREWIELALSPDVLRLHRGVKGVFDPRGVMNPGRAY